MTSGHADGRTSVTTLDPEEIDAAVRAERRSVAALLGTLTAEEWGQPSLCGEWTVREVAAHLTTTTRETPWDVLRAVVRARFDFDRMTRDVARDIAARQSTEELLRRLRESAESSRRVVLSGPMDPLMDVVVHAQDIARPLGRDHRTPLPVVVAATSYLAGNRLMGGPKRVRGLHLVATDAAWTHGAGPEVAGPVTDLLLAVAGRPAGLAALHGEGVPALAARLQ